MSFVVDSDPARLDFELVHRFLSQESYWAQGIPVAVARKALANSLCFGVYEEASGNQVGFCRFITDRATFGWLSDVFVLPEYRGKGISKLLVETALRHPDLQGSRRMLLATKDAHSLYERFGYKAVEKPEMYMEIWDKEVYRR